MRASVAAYAHRKLGRLERYLPASRIPQDALPFVTEVAADLGVLVGCYRNDGEPATDWIIFATKGISAQVAGERRRVLYADVVRIVEERTKDLEDDEVRLELRSQMHATIKVDGKDRERGTHDKYSVMMFLESVAGS